MSNLAVMNNNGLTVQQPSGSLSIQTVDDLSRIAKMMAASGFFADCKDTAQAGVKIMAGLELGFPAFASLVGIQIIKGKPVMGANLQAAAIKRSGKYNYRVKAHTAESCAIEFLERFDGKWESCGLSEFSMDDAKSAGLNGGDNWRKYPKNMLFARAVSNGVRWYCPDLFLGAPVYTPDEMGLRVADDGDSASDITAVVMPVKPRMENAVIVSVAESSNLTRLAQIREWTGHTKAQVKAIAERLDLKIQDAAKWAEKDCNVFFYAMLVDWSMTQSVFESVNHAESALDSLIIEDAPDSQLWEEWQEEIARRKAELLESEASDQSEAEDEQGLDKDGNPF